MTYGLCREMSWGAGCALTFVVVALTACSSEGQGGGVSDKDSVTVETGTGRVAPETSGAAPDDMTTSAADVPGNASEQTEEPTQAPHVVAGIAPDVAPDNIEEGEALDSLAEPLVEVQSELLANPTETDMDKLVTVADGPAQGQLLASIAEYESSGWSQNGTPQVISSTVESVDLDSDPPTVVLTVCLDHSAVDIVDDTGASMVDPAADKRVLNTFTMHYLDSRWVLHDRTFPVEVEC